MAFNITLEDFGLIKNLSRMPQVTDHETAGVIVDMAMWVKEDLRKRVPAVSGKLRNSIRYELNHMGAAREATFFALDYFNYLDEGTGQYGPEHHRIFAKNFKVMKFDQHQETWHHPWINGIKPKHYSQHTWMGARYAADRFLNKAGDRIFKAVIE